MRIAIFTDIHANLPAFEAALDHVARQNVDQLILAGDIVNGAPDSDLCWRLAKSLHCPMLWGNHEGYIAHYGTPQADPQWAGERFAPVRWAVNQLSEAERDEIRALPRSYRPPGTEDLLILHASLRSDRDSVSPYTPEETLALMFPHVQENLIVRGHNHLCQIRLWGDRTIVTAGSVGLPLNCHIAAQYVIVEQRRGGWHIQHQAVAYDVDAALARFHDTGYLAAAGPMGRLLMREVATASYYMVPFLRTYARWCKEGEIPLGKAVERWLMGVE